VSRKQPDETLSDREIAERMDKAIRKSLTMKPPLRTPKTKERPAAKGRVRKAKSRS
jgi:hypothetical protein